ncbi:MAG: HAD family hydrolase [Planctomycetota bacterium]|jgi:putative hydrolase of the HAD superfamily
MTMPAVRVVCFDLGGVVVRIPRSWGEGCRAAGLDVRGDTSGLIRGHPEWPDLNGRYQTGRLDVRAFVEALSTMMGGLYTPEEVLRVHHAWIVGVYDGIEDLVGRLHAAGLETAVLSNSCGYHWRLMEETLPAFRALRNRWGSHQLALRKPDEAIYRALESKVGARGGEIAFFDDLEENVGGALAAGWRAVQIDHDGDTARQVSDALAGMDVTL